MSRSWISILFPSGSAFRCLARNGLQFPTPSHDYPVSMDILPGKRREGIERDASTRYHHPNARIECLPSCGGK